MITTRIKEHDVLALMHQELLKQGRRLHVCDGEARQSFVDASRAVLKAVEDPAQKTAWLRQLAEAFAAHLPGMPIEVALRQLAHDPDRELA